MHRFIIALIVIVLVAACGSDSVVAPGSVDLRVTIDKTTYSLARDASATFVLKNHGTATVYAPMNEYVYVERRENGSWVDRRAWFAVDGISTSFPVEPGGTLSGFSLDFDYVDRRPGTYRFVFELALDPKGRRLVPFDQAASEPFTLEP